MREVCSLSLRGYPLRELSSYEEVLIRYNDKVLERLLVVQRPLSRCVLCDCVGVLFVSLYSSNVSRVCVSDVPLTTCKRATIVKTCCDGLVGVSMRAYERARVVRTCVQGTESTQTTCVLMYMEKIKNI